MYYPSIEDVEYIVKIINKLYDMDATIINRGQLAFALEKPRMKIFGHDEYSELYQKTASLMEVLTKAHVLSDGNKRCAMMTAQFMVDRNDAELLLPLKTIRLSVDTAMDEDDQMSEEIQQWFKVHIANNADQMSILLHEHMEETSIIENLLMANKINEAESLLDRWMAFDSYPKYKKRWEQLKEKWENENPAEREREQIKKFLSTMTTDTFPQDLNHLLHNDKTVSKITDLTIVDHTMKELLQYEKRIKMYEAVLQNTRDVNLLFSSAYTLERFGKIGEALERQKRILQIDPTQSHAYYRMGVMYDQNKDYRQSLDCFRKCLELNPAKPHLRSLIAINLMILNRNDEALKEINEALKINLENPLPHYLKSVIYANIGNFSNAKKSIQQALEMPADPKYIAVLGSALFLLDVCKEAIKGDEKAANIAKAFSMLPSDKTHVYSNLQHYDESIKYYDKILQVAPNHAKTLIFMGGIYSNMGKYETALRYLKRGLEGEPQNEICLKSMVITLEKIGEYDEAIKYLDLYIELDHRNIQLLVKKAMILLKQNKIDFALDVVKTIIQNQPNAKKMLRDMQELAKIRDSDLLK